MDGKLTRTPSKYQASTDYGQVPLSPIKPKTKLVNTAENGSMLSNFKRTNSFAVKPREGTRRQPFTRATAAGTPATLLTLQRETEQTVASGSKLPAELIRKEGIFSGKKFRAIGEANAGNVKSVVEGEDGFWITDDLDDADFIIVRLVWLVFPFPQLCAFSDRRIVEALSTGWNKRRPRNQSIEQSVGWKSVSLKIGFVIQMNT